MCLGQFYPEKNQKNAPCAIGVQLQIGVPKQTYIFSLDTSCLWYSIKCQTRGFLKLIVHKGTQQLAYLVTIQGGCSTYPPKQSKQRERAQFGSQAITLFQSELFSPARLINVGCQSVTCNNSLFFTPFCCSNSCFLASVVGQVSSISPASFFLRTYYPRLFSPPTPVHLPLPIFCFYLSMYC